MLVLKNRTYSSTGESYVDLAVGLQSCIEQVQYVIILGHIHLHEGSLCSARWITTVRLLCDSCSSLDSNIPEADIGSSGYTELHQSFPNAVGSACSKPMSSILNESQPDENLTRKHDHLVLQVAK